jgi:hypothetical protein
MGGAESGGKEWEERGGTEILLLMMVGVLPFPARFCNARPFSDPFFGEEENVESSGRKAT